MEHNIKIYTTPTCHYCKMTKEFLDENNVKYEAVDVTQDETARNEMIEKSGQMGVPVIDIDGQVLVGFNKEKLAELAGISA
ncbi:NrdH-redoxin [bacterium]|nr:NrdH-redoxin [bacterium]